MRGAVFLGPRQACDGLAPGTREALRTAGICAIVNCTMDVPNTYEQGQPTAHQGATDAVLESIEYCRVAVRDTNAADLLIYMRGASTFMERHIAAGRSVLVHCERGVSRSASIVIAHQVRFGTAGAAVGAAAGAATAVGMGMSRDEAYVAVKTVRQCADPNAGFWAQLATFERACAEEREAAGLGTFVRKRGGL